MPSRSMMLVTFLIFALPLLILASSLKIFLALFMVIIVLISLKNIHFFIFYNDYRQELKEIEEELVEEEDSKDIIIVLFFFGRILKNIVVIIFLISCGPYLLGHTLLIVLTALTLSYYFYELILLMLKKADMSYHKEIPFIKRFILIITNFSTLILCFIGFYLTIINLN